MLASKPSFTSSITASNAALLPCSASSKNLGYVVTCTFICAFDISLKKPSSLTKINSNFS